MIGQLILPWKPSIRLGGQTTYTPGNDGRIQSYEENWDISGSEALMQLFKPGVRQAEHWSGRLIGELHPKPKVSLVDAPTFVILPGFGNDAEDYTTPLGQDYDVGLQACLARRGVSTIVTNVRRTNWLRVFTKGVLDENFRAGNGKANVAFGWYLDLAKYTVEKTFAETGKPVVLLGHSAGGWLARALMQREGQNWIHQHVCGLVTLGTPHIPPPPGTADQTQGCLANLHKDQPHAFYAEDLFYVTVAGDAIVGEQQPGNIPILELIESQSTASTSFNSYRSVCGIGSVTGDGVVPLCSAHLAGATQVTIKGCFHSINKIGTFDPSDNSYLCEKFLDEWLKHVSELLGEPAGKGSAWY